MTTCLTFTMFIFRLFSIKLLFFQRKWTFKMNNHFNVLYLLIIAICYIRYTKAAKCDSVSGPSGAKQCARVRGYNDYQWVTCRTDLYIKLKTSGRYRCKNQFATYCRYHCMVDKYGKRSGDVYGSCQCSGSQKATYTFAFVVLLATVSSLLVL